MNVQQSIFDQPISFVQTRSRRNDCDTSKAAAKHAVSRKSDTERMLIRMAVLSALKGLTAREVATQSALDYIEVQRRISECGLTKTTQRRDGCAIWISTEQAKAANRANG